VNRLESELQRLYLPQDGGGPRAMVLELAGPANWDALARVWQGVQSDLRLPAPAIAVSGIDSCQLWFSLSEPVPGQRALAFLRLLHKRYWAGVPKDRIRMKAWSPGDPVPPAQAAPGQWSAFVSPDLAALFSDEPWLDLAPSPDAQADLLSRLQGIAPADFERALESLAPRAEAAVATGSTPTGAHQDPRSFLLEVMNDPAIDLNLRIEAAKALLRP
jgi:hypothetical protein